MKRLIFPSLMLVMTLALSSCKAKQGALADIPNSSPTCTHLLTEVRYTDSNGNGTNNKIETRHYTYNSANQETLRVVDFDTNADGTTNDRVTYTKSNFDANGRPLNQVIKTDTGLNGTINITQTATFTYTYHTPKLVKTRLEKRSKDTAGTVVKKNITYTVNYDAKGFITDYSYGYDTNQNGSANATGKYLLTNDSWGGKLTKKHTYNGTFKYDVTSKNGYRYSGLKAYVTSITFDLNDSKRGKVYGQTTRTYDKKNNLSTETIKEYSDTARTTSLTNFSRTRVRKSCSVLSLP